MEKVKTFLADISDLLNEKNYQKIYEKVPAFRQEKCRPAEAQGGSGSKRGCMVSLDEDTGETQDTARCRAVL